MKFLIVCLILTYVKYVLNESIEDYRVKSSSGRLPLYADLYYAINNKKYGNLLSPNKTFTSDFNPQNSGLWFKLEFAYNFDYIIIPFVKEIYVHTRFHFEPASDIYYHLVLNHGTHECTQHFAVASSILTCCSSCDGSEVYSLWKFIENPDYKLNAIMTDFQYEIPLQDIINQHIKKVDLLHTSIIENKATTTLHERLANEIKITQNFEITYSQSIESSSKQFDKFSVNAEIGGKFLGMGASASMSREFSMEMGKGTTTTNGNSKTVSKEVTYTIEKTVDVPPYERVRVVSYINWIDNLSLPYKAKVTVTGVAPRFETDRRLDSHSIKVLLNKFGFNETIIAETGNSITFEVRGTFTGSFGLDSYFSATKLNNSTNLFNTIQSNVKTDGYIISY